MPIIKTVQEGCKAAAAVYVTTIQPNTGHLGSETIRGLVTDCSMRSLVQRGRHRIPGSKVAQSHRATLQQRARRQKNRSLATPSRVFLKIFLALKSAEPDHPGSSGEPDRTHQRRSADRRPANSAEIRSGKSDTEPFSPAQPDAAWSDASASASASAQAEPLESMGLLINAATRGGH